MDGQGQRADGRDCRFRESSVRLSSRLVRARLFSFVRLIGVIVEFFVASNSLREQYGRVARVLSQLNFVWLWINSAD